MNELNEDRIFPIILKISQIIDLCFGLLSEDKRSLIMQITDNKKLSDIYIKAYHNHLPTMFSYRSNNYYIDYKTDCFFNEIKNNTRISTLSRYGYVKLDIDDIKSRIDKLKKKNYYTFSLEIIISHLLYFDEPNRIKFSSHSFIGEFFIEMGAIDSALKLYEIDKDFFYDANTLGLLANHAVKQNKLEWSTKLVEQLIKQEPYHPSIPVLQANIKRLEQRNRLKSTLSIDLSEIEQLSGIEFENLLLDKFIAIGFKVESTPKTGDFGADLIVENSEGTRIIVQCKRFKSKVNLKAVQEVVGAMGHYAGDYGVVITNNSFLNSAIKLAESHDIELWNGDKLVSFLAGDLSFSEIVA